MTFSVYNNLGTACGSDAGKPSGGQNTFLIMFMIIYTVYIVFADGLLLFLNFKKKEAIYKALCKAETKKMTYE